MQRKSGLLSALLVAAVGSAPVAGRTQDHVERLPDAIGAYSIPSAPGGPFAYGGPSLAEPPLAEPPLAEPSLAELSGSESTVPAGSSGVSWDYTRNIRPHQSPIIIEPGELGCPGDCWSFQVLPQGLIYRSYLAGVKESRFASQWNRERDQGWIWDIALGGRVGLLRYGTRHALRPQGWQLDLEGAAFPRIDVQHASDLVACDYRTGIPITYGRHRYQTKLAYYHLSSHLGDEWMLKWPQVPRINFCRDVLVWGHSFYWTDDLRLYAEAGWAFSTDDGSKPWEFQFGIDYSPAASGGLRPSPFFAINGHLREELDFGGNLVVQTGWQWRGTSGQLVRLGMNYYAGASDQYEFFDEHEEKVGVGIWYDY